MTGQQEPTPGDVVAPRADRGNVVNLRDAPLVARAEPASAPLLPAPDPSNVIPFARARHGASDAPPPVTIGPDDRPAPRPATASLPRDLVTLTAALAAHGLLVFAFWQEPRELPSIGIEAISVEIVVGDNRPAGAAQSPGETEAPAAPAEAVTAEERPAETEPQRTAEVRELTPEEKQADVVREQAVDEPPTGVAREPSAEQQPDTRSQVAMVQTRQAEVPTALPRETPPDMSAVISPPREQPNEVQPVEPKAKQPAQTKAEQKKKAEPRKQAARPAGTPSEEASGSGRQAIASNASYNGRVVAHLARHKQYPRSVQGIVGAGMVTFILSGSGTVTSVSITSGTGNDVLDQELTAMVRRASPFPAPPDGQPKTFKVPVNFKLPSRQ